MALVAARHPARHLLHPDRRVLHSGNLPFQLEPYRLLVGIVILLWGASLLVDPAVKVRATGFEGPIWLLVGVTLASVAANPGNVHAVQGNVIKALAFFLSFILFYYFITSVVNSWEDLELVLKIVLASSSVLGLLALIEYRWGFTPFNDLSRYVPLHRIPFAPQPRGGHIRAQASAEHPIAFGALMVMVLPLSIYAYRKWGRRWLICPPLLLLGALASVSRTSVTMIVAGALTIVWMRPRATYRFLWRPRTAVFLAVVLVGIKVAAPGTIGTLRYEFNPPGGIVADQSTSKGSVVSGGRLTDMGPVLGQVAHDPVFGVGYGTQVTGRESSGAYAQGRILDDQWPGTLWETGFAGLIVLGWWFVRYLRRVGAASRTAPPDERWLLVGLVAGVVSFAVGMLTYDAFSFIQEAFILYLFFALGVITMRLLAHPATAGEPAAAAPAAGLGGRLRPWMT